MRIVHGVKVRVGDAKPLTNETSDLEFIRSLHRTYEIPVIVGDIDPTLWDYIHIYLLEKASQGLKDLKPTAKAFLSWLLFLQDHNIDAFSNPKMRYKHPTYGYKHHLKNRVDSVTVRDQIASSIACTYINTIKAFYEMLVGLGHVKEGDFFKYESSIIDGHRRVQSTDLSIRIRRKHGTSLNPLDTKRQHSFRSAIIELPVEYRLVSKLMINCGLRLTEACTMTTGLFREEELNSTENFLVAGIEIGPKTNVSTKFDVNREIFITTSLYEEILDYIVSKRYQGRLNKWQKIFGHAVTYEPLFITSTPSILICSY